MRPSDPARYSSPVEIQAKAHGIPAFIVTKDYVALQPLITPQTIAPSYAAPHMCRPHINLDMWLVTYTDEPIARAHRAERTFGERRRRLGAQALDTQGRTERMGVLGGRIDGKSIHDLLQRLYPGGIARGPWTAAAAEPSRFAKRLVEHGRSPRAEP